MIFWMRTVVRCAQSAAYAVFIRFYCSYQAKIFARGISVPAGHCVPDPALFGRPPSASDQIPLYSSPETAYDFVYKKNTGM